METYFYSRYVDLYSLYRTDDRLSFLMKIPKGGFCQGLLSVQDGRRTDDSDWYTISSPMSLGLRLAKKSTTTEPSP